MKRIVLVGLPAFLTGFAVDVVVLIPVLVGLRAEPTSLWDRFSRIGLPLLLSTGIFGIISGSGLSLLVWSLARGLPSWLPSDLDSIPTEPNGRGASAFFQSAVRFYRDLITFYVRLDPTSDLQAWAGGVAMLTAFLLSLYVQIQGQAAMAQALIYSPTEQLGSIVASNASLVAVAQVAAMAAFALGMLFACGAAVGLFLLGRESRPQDRALATLVFVLSDLVWFMFLYHGSSVTGWALFQVSQAGPDRVMVLNAIDVAYLALGTLTTVGAPGITPANDVARLLVAMQIITIALVAIWLTLLARVAGIRFGTRTNLPPASVIGIAKKHDQVRPPIQHGHDPD